MVFSSNLFLFLFLPAFLLIYFGSPISRRNIMIFVSSVIFYTFGSGAVAWILLASVFFNYVAARALVTPHLPYRKPLFAAAVIVNLLPLFYYKYFVFTVATMESVGVPVALAPSIYANIVLPIGISFFTFQAISYLADVYSGVVVPARTMLEFGMYHTLFPQLVAGPIVRYVEIREAIASRKFDLENVAEGAYRFCIGLAKKVILADNLAPLVDHVFALPSNELSAPVCWLAVLCFSLQIYLDFSGYSDMAIGLGHILGFKFPENFNQPYRAENVTEFWRRWHMTLTRWFRDYVYIPLGGNRQGNVRTYSNLCIVFLLCGLWHGAAMTFVIWGAYHGLLLTIERILKTCTGWVPRGIPGVVLTGLLVTVGWVPFRAPSFSVAADFMGSMFGLHVPSVIYYPLTYYVTPANITYIIFGMGVAFFPIERFALIPLTEQAAKAVRFAGAFTVMALSIIMLSGNSFRPFIYFQF